MAENLLIPRWYVLHTRSRFESVVHDALSRKSLEAFLPRIRVSSKRRDRRLTLRTPLFPGYVFVKTDLNPNEHLDILKTAGAVRLIGNRSGPIHVPDAAVDSLKIMVAGDHSVTTGHRFRKGDRIIVVRGAFSGVTGIFNRYRGQGQVVVHIEALGQFAAVQVEADDIEALDKIHI